MSEKKVKKNKVEIVEAEIIESEPLLRNVVHNIVSPEVAIEAIKEAFKTLKNVSFSKLEVIKITSKAIDDETTLSVKDKDFYKFHLEHLFIVYMTETSDERKDKIFQEIIDTRKQLEESNRSRREYNAEETKKIQSYDDIISSKQMVVVTAFLIVFVLNISPFINKYMDIKS